MVRTIPNWRFQGSASLLMATALAGLLLAVPAAAQSQPQSRTKGLILSLYQHAAYDGDVAADCPAGLNLAGHDYYASTRPASEQAKFKTPDGKKALQAIIWNGAKGLYDRTTPNACNTPADYMKEGYLDPNYKTVQGKVALGMNLDGTEDGKAAANTCAHEKFTSPAGEKIDNQWWRVMGCIKFYRPDSDIQKYNSSTIKAGEMTIAMEISNLDDEKNDEDVTVGFYSSTDPAATDGSGNVVSGGSVLVHDNPRFHAVARGRIKDGVLTTDPVDVHFQNKVLIVDTEWWLRDARVKLDLNADAEGTAKGMIGGYFDVETAYSYIRQSTVSVSILGGYTCPSMYKAFYDMADGFPDPKTGKCTAISTAYQIEAKPGFVIHPRVRQAEAR